MTSVFDDIQFFHPSFKSSGGQTAELLKDPNLSLESWKGATLEYLKTVVMSHEYKPWICSFNDSETRRRRRLSYNLALDAAFHNIDLTINLILQLVSSAIGCFDEISSRMVNSQQDYLKSQSKSTRWKMFSQHLKDVKSMLSLLAKIESYLAMMTSIVIIESETTARELHKLSNEYHYHAVLARTEDSSMRATADRASNVIREVRVGGKPLYIEESMEKALYEIARQCAILPSDMHVEGVRLRGRHAVSGGGFADVWKATTDTELVALKVPRIFGTAENTKFIKAELCKEAYVWSRLRHGNILPLYGLCSSVFQLQLALVSPWMKNGDVLTYLKSNPKNNRLYIMEGISKGLNYLHKRNPPVVHGDIRCANILIDNWGRPVIADFGLSRIQGLQVTLSGDHSTSGRGSLRWQAPELLFPDTFSGDGKGTTASDVYAFGMTCLEILTEKVPFEGLSDAQVLSAIYLGRTPDKPREIAERRSLCDTLWNGMMRCWARAAERPEVGDFWEWM